MGRFTDLLRKLGAEWRNNEALFNLGCEIMGPPSGVYGVGTPLERADRVKAGREELERRKAAAEAERRRRFGQAAIRAYRRSRQMEAERGRAIQFEDDDVKVEVRNGYHWGGDKYTTDIMVIDRHSRSGAGWHVVFDDEGQIVHQGWKSHRG